MKLLGSIYTNCVNIKTKYFLMEGFLYRCMDIIVIIFTAWVNISIEHKEDIEQDVKLTQSKVQLAGK